MLSGRDGDRKLEDSWMGERMGEQSSDGGSGGSGEVSLLV